MTQNKLQKLRKKILFLTLIPDLIYFNLDSDEFHGPEEKIDKTRRELEHELGHYVMTYNRGIFKKNIPVEKHLCAHLKGAQLSRNQKLLLKKYEQKAIKSNVSFVVYQKPLVFMKPLESKASKLLN